MEFSSNYHPWRGCWLDRIDESERFSISEQYLSRLRVDQCLNLVSGQILIKYLSRYPYSLQEIRPRIS